MTEKLTPFEAESLRSGYLPPSAIAKVSPAMRRYHGIDEDGLGLYGTGQHPAGDQYGPADMTMYDQHRSDEGR